MCTSKANLMILNFIIFPSQSASAFASKCREQVLKKWKEKGILFVKIGQAQENDRKTASCNGVDVSGYRSRCPTTTNFNMDLDRRPTLLRTVSCAPKCNPKCCAVTMWVHVLKKQKSKSARRPEIWILKQQKIVVDYVKP